MMEANNPSAQRRHQIARHFSRAAHAYTSHDEIQQILGQRLMQYLSEPSGRIADIGCGPASLYQPLRALGDHYVGIDVATEMVAVARRKLQRTDTVLLADAESLPLQTACVDVCFANMSLQWCANLIQAITEMKRVLTPQGQAAFNLPLEGSFNELQQSWRQLDDMPHTQPFKSLNTVLSQIEQAGITGYHYAVIEHTQWFADLKSLMRSIKGVGANFVGRDNNPGLMTPRRFARLSENYEQYRTENGLPLTWRVGQFYFLEKIN